MASMFHVEIQAVFSTRKTDLCTVKCGLLLYGEREMLKIGVVISGEFLDSFNFHFVDIVSTFESPLFTPVFATGLLQCFVNHLFHIF